MKILVTGGAGFIGCNLVRHLLRIGSPQGTETPHDVLTVDALTYAGNARALAAFEGHPRHRFVQADIADAAAMRELFAGFRPDWVMHLAAESHVDRSIEAPAVFVQTNIVGTYTLLQAAREHHESLEGEARRRFRFLHVSTDEVFGSLGAAGLFTEQSRYEPHSPYSASKAAADHLVRAWGATYDLPVIVTHSSNNYGPWQYPEKLIPVVIQKALRGEMIPVYGTGDNVRDWLHVDDHAEALERVAGRGRVGESYNIGARYELKNNDLVRLLCGILDEVRPRADGLSYARQIAHVADRPGHDFRYALDTTKIKTELGWSPRRDPIAGFRETVKWYVEEFQAEV